ncbi:MAG: hypothetical protein JST68_22180 [Bacteroidetes bacterium]|nr:hypothetical protein [Bacteroidota bacterium]
MTRLSALVSLLLIGKLAFSQQDTSAGSAAFGFVDSVFRPSTVIFEINELRPPDSILAIMIKFNNAIAANKEWAAEYMNKVDIGRTIPANRYFLRIEYQEIAAGEKKAYMDLMGFINH